MPALQDDQNLLLYSKVRIIEVVTACSPLIVLVPLRDPYACFVHDMPQVSEKAGAGQIGFYVRIALKAYIFLETFLTPFFFPILSSPSRN